MARKRGELKRTKIILHAAEAFARKGYNATTLSDIARAVGTQAGSLYYHFASRDDIIREVLKCSMSTITDNVNAAWAALPDGTPPLRRILVGIRAHIRTILSDDPFLPAYNRIINEVGQDIRDEYVQYPRAYGAMWRELIAQSQAAGEIRASIDPSLARLLIFGSITWSQIWFDPKGPRSADEVADELIEICFSGMLTHSGAKAAKGLAD
ncbi:MAG TPA: TetR/AcrR family transcriptional regulator [Novosphingobium sp.]|nr:TetR/AcrR family transcriptional regulator [Novosphingobium sp.]